MKREAIFVTMKWKDNRIIAVQEAGINQTLETTPETTPVTILGAGYVGAALLKRLPGAVATRRRRGPDRSLIRFDLADRATWQQLPVSGRTVVITFPAEPCDLIEAFHAELLSQAAGVIALGSTSAYRLPPEAGEAVVEITEDAPLDLNRERVRGEEWLREAGATILQLAGIFGPDRDPADWLNRGRIRDGAKIVNLIHVDDIIAAILALVQRPMPGQRINVVNDEPIAWRDLRARLIAAGRVDARRPLADSIPGEHGKRVLNQRLRALMPEHTFQAP